MTENNMDAWTRRRFLSVACAAGSAALLASARGAQADTGKEETVNDELLRGVCDLHVHASPDVKPRSVSELSLARDCQKAGYRCVMFKSNVWSCHDRAAVIREAVPGFDVFGSIIMNRVTGPRVNPYAVEMALKTAGNLCRCVWMPTQDAVWQLRQFKEPGEGIPVLDQSGRVLPEVEKVMEICARADIIFATGHSSPEECLILAARAREVGVKKFVVTHANSHIWRLTHAQVEQVAKLGGWIEYSYLTNVWGPGTGVPMYERMSDKTFAEYVSVAPERTFVTTDMGQVDIPHPVDGMRLCLRALAEQGVSDAVINRIVRVNPSWLVGLGEA